MMSRRRAVPTEQMNLRLPSQVARTLKLYCHGKRVHMQDFVATLLTHTFMDTKEWNEVKRTLAVQRRTFAARPRRVPRVGSAAWLEMMYALPARTPRSS